MLVHRYRWSPTAGWTTPLPATPDRAPQLVLSFGHVDAAPAEWFTEVRTQWPAAEHVYCSGGGQINDGSVSDEDTIVTVIEFAEATVHTVLRTGVEISCSAAVGTDIGRALADVPALSHVLVFAEGISLNAAKFIHALNDELPSNVKISGGLASNGLELSRTVVGLNDPPSSGCVVAVGLAGPSIVTATGSVGGCELFGPERIVSRADAATVYELDGENALEVYKRYLGSFAAELPGIALLFPLAVWEQVDGPLSVRSILAIDESVGALRFGGDIPEGSIVRLMRGTTDRLIDGAASAARLANDLDGVEASLTLCVSCIGRRAVMRSRVEEELDEVVSASQGSPVVGFYSNGELAPPTDGREHARAVLHNHTMTVTSIGER